MRFFRDRWPPVGLWRHKSNIIYYSTQKNASFWLVNSRPIYKLLYTILGDQGAVRRDRKKMKASKVYKFWYFDALVILKSSISI